MSTLNTFLAFLFITVLISCNSGNGPSGTSGTCGSSGTSGTKGTICQFLYQGDFAYELCECKDWYAVPDSLELTPVSNKLVGYFPNQNFTHKSSVEIYSHVLPKGLYDVNGLAEYIINQTKLSESYGETVSNNGKIKITDSSEATILSFFNDSKNQFFATAYIEEPKHIVQVILATKDFDDFKTCYSSFLNIVKTYRKLDVTVIDNTRLERN